MQVLVETNAKGSFIYSCEDAIIVLISKLYVYENFLFCRRSDAPSSTSSLEFLMQVCEFSTNDFMQKHLLSLDATY